MPKVGTMSFRFKEGIRKFDLFYNSKNGFYAKGFPDDILRTINSAVGGGGKYLNNANTESELKSKLDEAIREYYDMMTTERHVIIIKLSLSNSFTMNRTGRGSFSGMQSWAKDLYDKIRCDTFGQLAYGIGFEYETGIIICSKEEKFLKTEQDTDGNITKRETYASTYRPEKYCAVIDYTREAEDFLIAFTEQLKKLAMKMATFLSDEKKLLEFIENKQKLLPQ